MKRNILGPILPLLPAIGLGAGCSSLTLSGSFDETRSTGPAVQVTDIHGGTRTAQCPSREAPASCPFHDIRCRFDDRGCEICVCEQ
ncbi:hypothetical protein KEG38_03585 [Polyangium jinanense]|nr:hypothetical protein [Polyangium jinanense]